MSEELFFNGINAVTGSYSLQPRTVEEIARVARGEKLDKDTDLYETLEKKAEQKRTGPFAVAEGIDPLDLSSSGWGVIFAHGEDPAIIEALAPLLEHRKKQVNNEQCYKEFLNAGAYRPGETKLDFLGRHNVGPGPVDPTKGVPYYLLIVGSPEKIPYRFQYQLDVQFAVGRIHFDTPEEYAQYAKSVVKAETGNFTLPRKATFFGVRNPDDPATRLSADHMIAPLVKTMGESEQNWTIDQLLAEQATKDALHSLLNSKTPPSLLYTASHGMDFPKDHELQIRHQGALLCQDWTGPRQWGRKPITENLYFSADDLSKDANLLGSIAFFFACYGGGTPLMDEFYRQAFKNRSAIAPYPFVAGLPQRMLSLPKGGALAAIGHIERAWGYSFMWDRTGEQLTVFESTLKRIMTGQPVGLAVEYLNERYAELATELTMILEGLDYGETHSAQKVAGMWTANNDARGYAIIGDPAVRLSLGNDNATGERPEIEPVTITPRKQTQPYSAEHTNGAVTSSAKRGVSWLEDDEPATFGLFNSSENEGPSAFDQVKESLSKAVQTFADQLSNAFSDAANVEVTTYTSPSEKLSLRDAKLRALTEIRLDGDITTIVPVTAEGEIDHELWQIHTNMVEQARNHRVEMLRLIMSAIPGLGNINK